MIKKRGKKGQFFIIAGIIISIIIIGIITISNYSDRNSNVKIQDLKDEIKIESSKVMDYILNMNYNQVQAYSILVNFTDNYIQYQKEKDIYFIFGSITNMTVAGSQKDDSNVSLNGNFVTNSKGSFVKSFNLGSGVSEINLSINKDEYIFPLNTGRNFYFLVKQEKGYEKYIIKG